MARTTAGVAALRAGPAGPAVLMVHDRDGRWTLPKGRVDRGEQPAVAAAREAREEAGVSVVVDAGTSTTWRHRRRSGRKQKVRLYVGHGAHRQTAAEKSWRRPVWVPLTTLRDLAGDVGHYRRIVRALDALVGDADLHERAGDPQLPAAM